MTLDPSRRRTMQSALAFTLLPLASLNKAHSMNTSTEATVVAANTKTPRDDGDAIAIRPFKCPRTDAD